MHEQKAGLCKVHMQIQLHPYSVALLLSAILAGGIAVIAWQRRNSTGAVPLAINMLSLAVWAFTYAMMWASRTMSAQIFWLNATYFGVVAAPLSFLVFVERVTYGTWLKRRLLLLLALEPIITFILVWTNDFHHLFHASFSFDTINGLAYLSWKRGPWFWVNVIYSYGLLLTSIVILARSILQTIAAFRIQLFTILMGAIFPLLASVVTQSWFKQISDLDLTPIAFSISGVFFAYAIFRQRLLDILPIARSILIESMSEGLIVLDKHHRILDINQTAQNLLGVRTKNVIGQNALDLYPEWADLIKNIDRQDDERHAQIQGRLDPAHRYDITIKNLALGTDQNMGYLMLFRDITEYWQAENELKRTNEQLAHRLNEITILENALREQAIRDPLTGVYNRRFLDEALVNEIERAKSGDYPLCVIMIDLDNFKEINDFFGHKAGDIMLAGLADQISRITRDSDLVCRYGGDEFLIILPNIPVEAASRRAEQVRISFENFKVPFKKFKLHTTASLGVAVYPLHGAFPDLLLRAADKALYASKAAGRNRVTVFDPASDMNTNPIKSYQ